MPTYQYACTQCGEQLEVVQSFSDDALTVCPSCEGRLRKVFSAVGIVFKGSGFYRNDSRPGSSTAAPASAGTADTSSTSDTSSTGAPSGSSSTASSGSSSDSSSKGESAA